MLFATASAGANILKANQSYKVGLLYYQAGIAVLTASMFSSSSAGILRTGTTADTKVESIFDAAGRNIDGILTGSAISASADGLRARFYNTQFNNTVELNSSIYFCRANHNEFNYSANPTYLSGSTINVKTDSTDPPVSYITTIGLYSADNQLLAVGKLSEPLKKDSSTEVTLRARLDY